MALVTVTGNVWDHTGAPIPADRRPELWFRPRRPDVAENSLLAGVEVRADLNSSTGAFSVRLEAWPGSEYRPFLRWLINPDELDPEKWAFGYAEWSWTVNPYPNGGPIGQLAPDAISPWSVLVSLDPPPPGYRGWYLNAPGPGQPPGNPDDPASSGTGILEIVS